MTREEANDIVARLRVGHQYSGIFEPLHIEAAAEIERLRAEVKQCSTELGEAAKLLAKQYPRMAGIFEEARGRARIAIGLTPCDAVQQAPREPKVRDILHDRDSSWSET
jgi:hypothetical protein